MAKTTAWESLPAKVKEDLTEWYNSSELDDDDKERLAKLWNDGKFDAWDCPTCDERVYKGEPDDWGHFQGVRNQDFSFFGFKELYTEEVIEKQCNQCRCHGPKGMKLVGDLNELSEDYTPDPEANDDDEEE